MESKFPPFAQKSSLLQKVTKENKLAGIFVDLGIYGWSPLSSWAGKDPTLRMFEKFTLKHGGYQVFQSFQINLFSSLIRRCEKKHIVLCSKGLYADTLMSFEEFFQMFSEFGEAYAKVMHDMQEVLFH